MVKPDIPDTLVDESSPTLSPPREPKHNVIHIGIRTDSFSHKHDDYVLHVHAFDYTGYRLTNGYYHLFMSHDTVQKMVSIPETPVVVVPDVEIDLPIKQVKPAVYTGDYEVELQYPAGLSVIHVPLKVDGVRLISDVMRLFGDNLVYLISFDSANQEFIPHYRATDSDREFDGQEAFIVYFQESFSITLKGKALDILVDFGNEYNLIGFPRQREGKLTGWPVALGFEIGRLDIRTELQRGVWFHNNTAPCLSFRGGG